MSGPEIPEDFENLDYDEVIRTLQELRQYYRESDTDEWIAPGIWYDQKIMKLIARMEAHQKYERVMGNE